MKSPNPSEEVEIEFILPKDVLDFAQAYAAQNGTTVEKLVRQHLEELEASTLNI